MAHNSQFLSLEPELRNIIITKNPGRTHQTAQNQVIVTPGKSRFDTPGQSRSQYTVKTPSLSHDIDKYATGNHNLEISRSVYHIYDKDHVESNNNSSNNLKDHHFPSDRNSNVYSGQNKASNKNKNQEHYDDLYDSFSNIKNKSNNNYNIDNHNYHNKYENNKIDYAPRNDSTRVGTLKIKNPNSPSNQSTIPSLRSVLASNGQMISESR